MIQSVLTRFPEQTTGPLPMISASTQSLHPVPEAATRVLRIAFCLPERQWLEEIAAGQARDAARIQQGYLAAGLRNRGHRLTLMAPDDLQGMVYIDNMHPLTCAPQSWSATRGFALLSKGVWHVQQAVGIRYLNLFANLRRFDAALRSLPNHDLVYERNGVYNVGVALACQRLKLPYVMFFDADQIAEHDFVGRPITGWQRRCAQLYLRYNLRSAKAIICVSEPARHHLIRHWGAPAEKIVVFPNGVDVQRFQPDPAARSATRRALGVGTAPLVIFVGNFYEWHDIATLLNAFAQVLLAYPETRLLLVGDGPQRQAMMQHADKLDIGYAVQFTGLVAHAEVPYLIAAADIAVAPVPLMLHDMWLSPMKLFEYMASGVALVASAVGQLTDVIQADRNGCLVPPGDVAALTAVLQRLIHDPALRMRLGRQAREDAVRTYSWEEYVIRLERVYRAVLAGEPVNFV